MRAVDVFPGAHAVTALCDGVVWQWIAERQGDERGMVTHAHQCIQLLLGGRRS